MARSCRYSATRFQYNMGVRREREDQSWLPAYWVQSLGVVFTVTDKGSREGIGREC